MLFSENDLKQAKSTEAKYIHYGRSAANALATRGLFLLKNVKTAEQRIIFKYNTAAHRLWRKNCKYFSGWLLSC